MTFNTCLITAWQNILQYTYNHCLAIKAIATASQTLQSKQVPHLANTELLIWTIVSRYVVAKGEAYQVLQNNLSAVAASLNIAGSKLVAGSCSTPEQLAKASTNVAAKYQELLTVISIKAHHITCTCTS